MKLQIYLQKNENSLNILANSLKKLNMKKSIKGIWLYGQSGSGKSTISKLINKGIKNSFIIDGDIVRKK